MTDKQPTPAELREWQRTQHHPGNLIPPEVDMQPALFKGQTIYITAVEAAWLRKRGHARWSGARCAWIVDEFCGCIPIRFTPKEAR